jgi:hypothetical protein
MIAFVLDLGIFGFPWGSSKLKAESSKQMPENRNEIGKYGSKLACVPQTAANGK